MSVRYYKVHDFLTFKIVNNSKKLWKLFDLSTITFSNFQVEKNTQDADFTVEVGPFKANSDGCIILDDNYHIRKNYILWTGQRKYAVWKVEIDNLGSRPVARIQTNLAGSVTKILHLVEFLIHYCLLKRGVSVIHAGGISHGGAALLLPGTSGGGKTTITLSLIDRGYEYLGDNYIIVHRGKAYSYLTPLNVFYYNSVPLIERSLRWQERCSLALRKYLYNLTDGYIKIFKKLNPARVCPGSIVPSGKISHLCFLEPNSIFNQGPGTPEQIDMYSAVRKCRYNMELEWMAFANMILSYGLLYPESLLARFWKEYEAALTANLGPDIHTCTLGVPSCYRPILQTQTVDYLTKFYEDAVVRK